MSKIARDVCAYFGSNDSVNGPYKTIADKQPMGVDKIINDNLIDAIEQENEEDDAIWLRDLDRLQ